MPGSEVVLVEDDEVPAELGEPFASGLEVSGGVAPEQILERAEIDERPVRVGIGGIFAVSAGQVLPAVEIDMRFKVGFPGVFDCLPAASAP